MTLNADNVRLGTTGHLWWDQTGQAAAPTDTTTAPATAYVDVGYLSEDGLTFTMPGAGDTTAIKAWQDAATVRTIRSPSTDSPTMTATFIETKLEVIEIVFGVTVEQDTNDGSFVINANQTHDHGHLILDVEDENERIRLYGPNAVITEIGDITFSNGDPIGYAVTFAFDFDQATNGHVVWFGTALAEAV